jgi:hypothetical protein
MRIQVKKMMHADPCGLIVVKLYIKMPFNKRGRILWPLLVGLSWKELVTLAGEQLKAGKFYLQADFKGKQTNDLVSICK